MCGLIAAVQSAKNVGQWSLGTRLGYPSLISHCHLIIPFSLLYIIAHVLNWVCSHIMRTFPPHIRVTSIFINMFCTLTKSSSFIHQWLLAAVCQQPLPILPMHANAIFGNELSSRDMYNQYTPAGVYEPPTAIPLVAHAFIDPLGVKSLQIADFSCSRVFQCLLR